MIYTEAKRDDGAVVVTSEMVHELRNTTGEGMLACKAAIIKAHGDLHLAKEYLR